MLATGKFAKALKESEAEGAIRSQSRECSIEEIAKRGAAIKHPVKFTFNKDGKRDI